VREPRPHRPFPQGSAWPLPRGSANGQTFATVFGGARSNGDWALYIFDNGGTNSNIRAGGGWCLKIFSSTPIEGSPWFFNSFGA
jgi:hypothetical protein